MLTGPMLPSVIAYTIPIILTSLLQLFFNAADLIIVGRFCGELSVAAVGNSGSITNLTVNLFIGLSVGTGVTVAQALGAGRSEDVRRAVHTALPAALVSGIVVTIVGMTCTETFLRWMDTPETVLPLSAVYMKICFAGAVFMMIYNFCAAILRAAGDTKSPLIFLTIAGVINVGLNVVFVTALDMNVAGVALATTISQAVSAILVVIALMRRNDDCKLVLSQMRIYKEQLLEILRIGLPAGIQSSLFSVSNVIIQSSINSFGDILMSGNAAAGNIEGFMFAFLSAFGQTAVNFIGQNAGARQYKRVAKVLWTCLGCILAVGAVVTTATYLLGPTLLSIYIPDSPEAVQWGMVRLSCLCFAYILCGIMDTSTSALRGMGVSVIPMVVSVLGVCGIRIGWIATVFQIPQFHTPQCLYFSYTVSWIVTLTIQLIAFFVVHRNRSQSGF